MARLREQPGGDQVVGQTELAVKKTEEIWRLRAFAFLDLFDELRDDLEDIADDTEI